MTPVSCTKMIATVSPLTDDEETLKGFITEGIRIFRINFSHGTTEEHAKTIANLRKVSKEMGVVITICLDTRGPELRIEIANTSEIPMKKGENVTFMNVRKPSGVFLGIEDFTEITPGSKIYLDDGMMGIEVIETTKNKCVGMVLNTHRLKNNKKVCFPGTVFKNSISIKKDKEDIQFGIENDIDIIFASFVNNKEEVEELRKWVHNKDIKIYSKIETLRGYHNIDEIIEASDGIVIARGDLCVELNYNEMFSAQKIISEKCLKANKPFICATQMLETMINNVKPSRAEITDIGNAVLDRCDGLMLSGETAVGEHPVLVVEHLRNIISNAERFYYEKARVNFKCPLIQPRSQNTCVIIRSSSEKAIDIIYRRQFVIPVFIVSDDEKFLRRVNLYRGLIPHLTKETSILYVINEIKDLHAFERIYYVEMNANHAVQRIEVF
ncbi:Pyruvate kinase [Nosema granulosis]|uniref:Pyruvate kinase n=1 Tax=Nosema granulosis TaxID=83296 RepID=A0A9P6GY66_9MICR|nr:Pyruvate kinase [Nosema granulosis]